VNIKPSNHTGNSVHQTVTEFIKLKTPEQTIQIGFTDQKVSGRAGLLTFAGFLHWLDHFDKTLAGLRLILVGPRQSVRR